VVGPLKTPSLKGNWYYILFIDDFTRMCWILFMKYKSEVVKIFWRFKKNMENQSRCRIQAIRSENGKEYTLLKFNLYCEDAGIEHQLTAPYTPEQNRVSEKRNKYIMEMVRCMLHEKDLPKILWVEVANIAVFL
jgi:transposase InsO family protein